MKNKNSYVDDLMGLFSFVLTPSGLCVIIEKKQESALKSKELYLTCNEIFGHVSKREFGELLQAVSHKMRQSALEEIE